jgi:hypothetical protein
MHDNGRITCSKKPTILDLTAQLQAAMHVGNPIVTIPNPIKSLKANKDPIKNAVIGKLKNAPINGKIKLIPEKKNLCEPSIKFSLNKDKMPMQNPNTPKNRHFLTKSLMATPIKKDFRPNNHVQA